MSSIEQAKIKTLASSSDWEEWNEIFKTKAITARLWKCIDPKSQEPFRTEPIEPNPEKFKTNGPTRNTRGQSSGSQSTTTPSPPITADDLTGEDSTRFTNAWNRYESKKADYETQLEAIGTLQDWVLASVSPRYRKQACKSGQTLREWYAKLVEHASADDDRIKEQAREAYKRATAPLKRAPKNWETWISNWEEALTQAQEKDVAETNDPAVWFNDFINAVRPVVPDWAVAYKHSNKKEYVKEGASYRSLAKEFSEEISSRTESGRNAAKGAFTASDGTPQFGSKSSGQESDHAEGDAP